MKSAPLKTALLCAFAFALPLCAAASSLVPHRVDISVQQWNGNAIAYSGYRVGQSPQLKKYPTQAEILEDLTILKRNWKLIRLYGADQHSEDVLKVIQHNNLGMRVMLGIWLDGKPGHEKENAEQIAAGIRLANKYNKIVVAVSVGNEALVSWSDHKMTEEQAIEYVKEVRRAVKCPVTVADDFLYWRQPDAKLANYVDFITMHTYPLWGHEDIDTAMASTIKDYESVCRAHPGKTIVIGEAGWASNAVGDKFIPRAGNEMNQKHYFEDLSAWAKTNNVTIFFFEAFDEPWKGAGAEGHWGLFSVERKAKLAMRGLYPELTTAGQTLPSYDSPRAAK